MKCGEGRGGKNGEGGREEKREGGQEERGRESGELDKHKQYTVNNGTIWPYVQNKIQKNFYFPYGMYVIIVYVLVLLL